MGRLNIAERRQPQDGRIAVGLGQRDVNLRISTIPSIDGERIVMRLLESSDRIKQLSQLGMSPDDENAIQSLIEKPNGIILATGPTGSGKTTSLYAILQQIDTQTKNVMTVEDPVEYKLAGISQTPIDTKVGMSFASGLKAILRQDPDVVLVGEIRDSETAQIAAQASLTGHLVLSSLHTNRGSSAITRLRDLGTEPYIIAEALRGILSQRLIRTLCPHCKQLATATPRLDTLALTHIGRSINEHFTANGCTHCHGVGYDGRVAVFELIVVDEIMRQLIHNESSEAELERHARASSPGLMARSLALVAEGLTSLEEVLRAVND